MTREEFESILEEFFFCGYNDAEEDIYNESMSSESKSYIRDQIKFYKEKGINPKSSLAKNLLRSSVSSYAGKDNAEESKYYANKGLADAKKGDFISSLINRNKALKKLNSSNRMARSYSKYEIRALNDLKKAGLIK